MGNSMWAINNLLQVLFVVVSISQVDIAILRVIYSELTSVYTIRLLLNDKQFTKHENIEKNNYTAIVNDENV